MTRTEDGAAAPMALLVAMSLFLFGGVLVVDGGFVAAAQGRAQRIARAAAADAALQLDRSAYLAGSLAVDKPAASERAAHLVARTGHAFGGLTVDGDTVTVSVARRQRTPIAALVGVPELTVTATGSARIEAAG